MSLHPCFNKCSRFSGERCATCLVSDEMASTCTASDLAKNQAQMDLQENEPDTITAGHRIDEPQILVRPDEAEILPQCAACTTKDHDLKALRKLQASNISIYAGRVHSQQTQIMLREIIICVLVIAWIGLFLWGLK